MRYFKILNPETGEIAGFGKNDNLGVEITEEEYNALCAEHCPFSDEATVEDYEAALAELGVTE